MSQLFKPLANWLHHEIVTVILIIHTVGNTAYICIPVEKSNKTGNLPSKKSKTCAIDKEENCTTYMRQYMRKRRANESNDDRAKRLEVQRDTCKETKAMLGHAISLFHSLVSKV